jgi:uncharacterized protein (DUF779 family)
VRVTVTERAAEAVRTVAASGRSDLVMVLGTGCCDSTAPFLYDHHYPGADAVEVGRVGDVPMYAPAFLAGLYAGDDGLVVDVEETRNADSFSLETEHGLRFMLRLPDREPARP